MTDVDNLVKMTSPFVLKGFVFLFLNLKNSEIGDAHALDRLLSSLATGAL